MKKSIKICLIALVAIFIGQVDISATHIVGGNITYKHLQGDTYQIDFTFRRDCFTGADDAQFDNQAIIYVFDDQGNIVRTVGLDGKIVMNLNPDDTLNTTIRSDCGFVGNEVCVHETIYRETVSLPYRPGGYNLVYQRCCRNPTLANILEADDTGGTWMTWLTEEALASHNSSPMFKEWPDIYVCADQDLDFDHSATDADGDSLAYKLYTPYSGLSDAQPIPFQPPYPPYDTVQWKNGYSRDNMLGSQVPLTINAQTGMINGIPDEIGQYLVGVLVEEYRNGELIGITRRDFQYNVRTCIGRPQADFVANDGICAGPNVVFENTSTGEATDYIWNFNYPSDDPQFMSTEENPTYNYATPGVYQVQLIATRGSMDSCRSEIIKTVAAINADVDQDFDLAIMSCAGNGDYVISLTDLSVDNEPGQQIIGRAWTLTQENNNQTGSGETTSFTVNPGAFSISQRISSSSGCEMEISREYNTDDFAHTTDFLYSFEACNDDNTVSILFTDQSDDLNPYDSPENIVWTITTASGVENFNGTELLYTVDKDALITVNQAVDFGGGCTASEEKEIDVSTFRPRASYNYGANDCPDDETVSLFFEDTSESDNDLYTVTSIRWSITNLETGEEFTSSESRFDYSITKDEMIRLVQIVTFENGCIDTLTEEFIPGPYPTINFTSSPRKVCLGDTVSIITNPNSDWTYEWSPLEGLYFTDPADASTAQIVGGNDRVYSLTVSDGICSVTDKVSVETLDGESLAIEGARYVCDNQVSLSVSGGIPPGDYEWSLFDDFSQIIETGSALNTILEGDSMTYYVRYTGETCGENFRAFEVKRYVYDLIYANPIPVCSGDEFPLEVSNEGPKDVELTYIWSDSPYLTAGQGTSSPTITIPDDISEGFVISLRIENEFGCIYEDDVVFDIATRPSIDFISELTDCGSFEVCFKEDEGYYGFPQWDFGDPTTENDISIMSEPCYTYPGPGIYEVTLKNVSGLCAFEAVTHQVTINDEINIDEIGNQKGCMGSTINISASSPDNNITYNWYNSDGELLVTGKDFSGIVNESYDVVVVATDPNGCSASETINISPYTYDVITNIPDLFCTDQEFQVELTVNGETEGFTYEWSPASSVISGGDTANPVLYSTGDNAFRVVITDIDTGCKVIEEFIVKGTSYDIDIEADPDADINLGEVITLGVVNGDSSYDYIWSTGETSQDIDVSPEVETVYSVTVTDENGCMATDSVTVTVRQPQCNAEDIFIPNAFTPNGDGENEIFIPRSNFIETMELVVYNRWGQEVFRSNDPSVGWDGTYNGEKLEPDAFAYYVIIGCPNNLSYKEKGNINLLK